MRPDRIIVDANIAFRCLIAHRGDVRVQMLQQGSAVLFTPRYLFVELFKHKQRIVTASKLSEDEVLEALYTLSSQLRFYNESLIPLPAWVEAVRLCGTIDGKDTPYVALTLHLNGRLWTQDEVLKQGLRAKGFDRFFEP